MTDPSISVTRCAQPGVPSRAARRRAHVRRWRAPSRCAAPCPLRGTRPAAGPRAGPVPPGGAGTGRTGASLGAGCQARPGTRPGRLDAAAGVEADACGPGRQASPPRPAGTGRPPLPRQRRGRAVGHRPGPPRARPCRPSPPAGPGASRTAPPHSAPARPFLLSPFPGWPPRAAANRQPAGGGTDAASESGASVVARPRRAAERHPARPPPPPADQPGARATRC